MTKIRYRPCAGTASGRRTGWIKYVTSVDPDARDGHGVHGNWLKDGQLVELPAGAIILKVDPEGSVSRAWQSAHVFRLDAGYDGEFELIRITKGQPLDWRQDFLKLRDALIDALEQEPSSPLAGAPDEELLAELRRRIERGLDLHAWLGAVKGVEEG